ncbi:type II toxin-antitoxin system PrlF family antitoxin [Sphingopyxis indica]|uniref:Antitoxin PrlF n=1 Tax=Sphingopyxis indica TaxID=436663 RepID=A0A239L2X9_9SPHN|nr:type II toxin-antitoxin system PrlF family antitoxin [Sphingopyxis indica]SNT23894.1 antitoxin PrlF [Sphingopyxis indica]
MPAQIEEISTITAKGQTTIPKAVRQALGVAYGGKITFRVDDRGVSVHRAETEHEDPVIDRFLAFLADDIQRRPEAVVPLTPALAERLAKRVEGVDVDLDAPIDGDVAL